MHQPSKVFTLTKDDFKQINPNTLTCPIFRDKHDAEITKVFIAVFPSSQRKMGDNPWGISFLRMFDMTNDSGLFSEVNLPDYLPLYEAKMIEDYDHRFAGVIHYSDRIRTGEPEEATLEEHSNPKFSPRFRYWVKKQISQKL